MIDLLVLFAGIILIGATAFAFGFYVGYCEGHRNGVLSQWSGSYSRKRD